MGPNEVLFIGQRLPTFKLFVLGQFFQPLVRIVLNRVESIKMEANAEAS